MVHAAEEPHAEPQVGRPRLPRLLRVHPEPIRPGGRLRLGHRSGHGRPPGLRGGFDGGDALGEAQLVVALKGQEEVGEERGLGHSTHLTALSFKWL